MAIDSESPASPAAGRFDPFPSSLSLPMSVPPGVGSKEGAPADVTGSDGAGRREK